MPTTNGSAGLTPVAQHRWERPLRDLRADALDCLQTTIALVAEDAYGDGAHVALGSRWQLGVRRDGSTAHVERSLDDRLRDASELLDVRATARWSASDGRELRNVAADVDALCVVADAYYLPWVPYAGHEHMAHGFLLARHEAGCLVVDAYHNDTAWGPARPGAWAITEECLDDALDAGAAAMILEPAAAPPTIDAAATLEDNAARASAADDEIDRYVADLRTQTQRTDGLERLVLDVWLLARERALYTSWLETLDDRRDAARDARSLAQRWRELAAQSYLAMRRSRRGARRHPAVVDDLERLLRDDARLTASLSSPAGDGHDDDSALDVRTVVVEALRDVLGVDDDTIVRAETLRDLPGFDSFRLVEVMDRVERRLEVELPADIAADDLRHVAGLCRVFSAASAGAGRRVS